MSESDLLRRAVHDDDGFEAIYRRHAPRLLRWLERETSREEALDLVAETFARMLISVERFRGEGDLAAGAWLNRIARNLLREHVRGRGIEARALRRLQIEAAVKTALAGASTDTSPDLAEALGQLSPAERAAVQLRIVDELPYDDVARILEIRPDAARTRVSRALRGLGMKLREAAS